MYEQEFYLYSLVADWSVVHARQDAAYSKGKEPCNVCGRSVSGKAWYVVPTGMGHLIPQSDWEAVFNDSIRVDHLGVQFVGSECAKSIPAKYKARDPFAGKGAS